MNEDFKLQKVLAMHGIASRRTAEEIIKEGRITVNGKPAHIGMRVKDSDAIHIDGKVLVKSVDQHEPCFLIYHKPIGQVCTRHDPEGRPTVFDELPKCPSGRWVCVGRLDINTTGLLLFTNSGDLADRLMHPRYKMEREYAIRTLGRVTPEICKRLTQGIMLEDGLARFEHIVVTERDHEGANSWCTAVLVEGRTRVVRRLFEAVDLMVSRLVRVRFGPITLPERLGRGRSRILPADKTKELVELLKQTDDDDL
jgi:23S rRNA pseudouridine2605 synthase